MSLHDPSSFQLFETMYATRAEGVRLYHRHECRLAASAAELRFRFDPEQLRMRLSQELTQTDETGPLRVRVALAQDGELRCTVAPLPPLDPGPVRVLLASSLGLAPQDSGNSLLRHKTTVRKKYDEAIELATRQGAFDVWFINERGELTEGARSNLFLRLAGRWVTPPLTAGLLPGVMRAALLEDPAWDIVERPCTLADLAAAEELLLSNALRGACAALLVR